MSRAVSSLALTRDPRVTQDERTESERLRAEVQQAVARAERVASRVRRMNAIYRERLTGVRRPER